MFTLPPSPWREFLQSLDAKMSEMCILPCFGGFAVTLAYGISRSTSDIDVLNVTPRKAVEVLLRAGGKGSPLALQHKIFLDFVGVANPPYEYESRLRPMYEGAFAHLRLMVMDPYDVALTKLKRDSDIDFQDVLALAEKIPFDIDLFEKRYLDELRDNTTGTPGANDAVFYRWKESILKIGHGWRIRRKNNKYARQDASLNSKATHKGWPLPSSA